MNMRVGVRNRVVFEPALTARAVAAAIVNEHGEHDRKFFLMDQVVQRGRNRVVVLRVVSVLHDDERRWRCPATYCAGM